MTDLNIANTQTLDEQECLRSQQQLDEKLGKLKLLDFDSAVVSLWVVHRSLTPSRQAKYSALKVDASPDLRVKLRKIVKNRVDLCNQVEPYEYVTEDQDERIFEIPVDTTDYMEVITLVNRNGEEHKIEKTEQLMQAWGYVIKLQIEDQYVHAFRKLGAQWGSKKSEGWNWFMKNHVLMELEEKVVFKADHRIDFLGFDGSVFILNKKDFEQAMNFREGMVKHRDEIIREFEDLGIFNDTSILKSTIGDNLHRLRRISMVRKSGFYRYPWYMEKLEELNKELSWGLTISEDSVIEVTEDNVDLILTLLNNDRLKSPITDQIYDVAAKKPVESTAN